MKWTIYLAFLTLLFACQSEPASFDVQGHRGCRGHYPENSIEGFMAALEMGVTTLELDVVISKDRKVVISHEPWLNPDICKLPDFDSSYSERTYNIYKMPYDSIRTFDCGSLTPSRFPEQKSLATYKPLLEELIDRLYQYAEMHQTPLPLINLETKLRPEGDHLFHPGPEEFVQLVFEVLQKKNYLPYTSLQSFDIRSLVACRAQAPNVPIVLLVDEQESVDSKLTQLGFTPDILSPHHGLVNEKLILKASQKQMKVIPWTINEIPEMKRVMALGVDGIISDYPDRVISLLP